MSESKFEALAARDASLGVGHIWTAVQCPAYVSYVPRDCTCGGLALSCGHRAAPSFYDDGMTFTPGYARIPDEGDRKVCYACADDMQRAEMRDAMRFAAYLSADWRSVISWTGGHLARVTRCTGNRTQTFVRAVDTHGNTWAGIGPAESGTYVNLRRTGVKR